MTAWWDGPMLGLDFETTAAEPEDARIVQAALVKIGPRVEGAERGVDAATWLVNPRVEIPQQAIDVHGITNERVRADGDAPELVLAQIMRALSLAARNPHGVWPVVGFNARYDLTVLDRELRRHGYAATADILLPALLVVCPLTIDRHLWKFRPKAVASRSLTDCCRAWRVPFEGVAHDASFDATVACRLAWRLATSGRVIRRTRDEAERQEFIALTQSWEHVRHDLRRLHAWQQMIARDDAAQLEAWFHTGDARKGVPPMPNRRVPRDWPIVPVGTDWGDPTPVQGPESEAELTTPEWTR